MSSFMISDIFQAVRYRMYELPKRVKIRIFPGAA